MRFFCHSKNRRVTEVSGIFVWTRIIRLNVYASPLIYKDEQTRREGMTTQELSSEEFVITSLVEPCLTLSAVSLMLVLKIRYLPILGLVARNVLNIRTVIASGRNVGVTDKLAFSTSLISEQRTTRRQPLSGRKIRSLLGRLPRVIALYLNPDAYSVFGYQAFIRG